MEMVIGPNDGRPGEIHMRLQDTPRTQSNVPIDYHKGTHLDVRA